MRGAREQSPVHSAHVGQEVEVHYRWHALYGRRVRRQYVERRAGGEVVHVELARGMVIVVPAWMLDPDTCAGMEFGAPRVTVSALAELHQLLTEHGFRESSRDDATIVQKEQHEDPAPASGAIAGSAPAQHRVRFRRLRGMTPTERQIALARLASLLLEAATSPPESVTMTNVDLLPATVLKRKAVVYVRQSTQEQVQSNLESQRRQYELVDVARQRGFRDIEGHAI